MAGCSSASRRRPAYYEDGQAGDGREDRASEFVRIQAETGKPDEALTAFEEFHSTSRPLLHIGAEKGKHLDAAVRARRPGRCLELGAYLGYSAIRIGRLLDEGGTLLSIESCEANARLAKENVAHAGLDGRVRVLHGTAETLSLIREGAPFDFILLDHKKSLYFDELRRLEAWGLVQPGCIVAADNIGGCVRVACQRLHCGCSFADYVRTSGRYRSENHWGTRDGLEVSECLPSDSFAASVKPPIPSSKTACSIPSGRSSKQASKQSSAKSVCSQGEAASCGRFAGLNLRHLLNIGLLLPARHVGSRSAPESGAVSSAAPVIAENEDAVAVAAAALEADLPACALASGETVSPRREDLPEVPGAYVIHGALSVEEVAAFARTVRLSHRGGAKARRLPEEQRRDSQHHRGVRVSPACLSSICARLRPLLSETAGPDNAAGLEEPTKEISTFLRCYHYLPGDASKPHYDRSATVCEHQPNVLSSFSAFSLLMYVGDECQGGATTFFEHNASVSLSGKGLTPLCDRSDLVVAAKVQPLVGDILIFPHGRHPGCHPNPLHEGSTVISGEKLLVRTDVMYRVPPGKRKR